MTRAPVFLAPVGTPPAAADAWTHIGYAEDLVIEGPSESLRHSTVPERLVAEVVLHLRMFRQVMPLSEQCRRTAQALEEWR